MKNEPKWMQMLHKAERERVAAQAPSDHLGTAPAPNCHIYAIDVASGWNIAASVTELELQRFERHLCMPSQSREPVGAAAPGIIRRAGGCRLPPKSHESNLVLHAAVAALMLSTTWATVKTTRKSLRGHWLYLAYSLPSDTLGRPTYVASRRPGMLAPEDILHVVARAIRVDQASARVGTLIKAAGGMEISACFKEL